MRGAHVNGRPVVPIHLIYLNINRRRTQQVRAPAKACALVLLLYTAAAVN